MISIQDRSSVILILHYFQYLFIRTAAFLINSFPISISSWMAERVGDSLYYLLAKRRKTCLDNLDLAYGSQKTSGEKKHIAHKVFSHVLLSLLELLKMPAVKADARKNFTIVGGEYLDQAAAKNRGVILVMTHLGSWEYLAFLPYLKGYPCTILGKRIRNPFLSRWVKALRKSVELDYCDRNGGLKVILSEIHKKKVVALVVDQWAGNDGAWIDFFGRPASTTTLPARLASKTQCALVPMYCLRTQPGRYQLTLLPEIATPTDSPESILATTKEINALFEKIILDHPEQWIWTHRRWKGKKQYAQAAQDEGG